jgi:hypothetical protein
MSNCTHKPDEGSVYIVRSPYGNGYNVFGFCRLCHCQIKAIVTYMLLYSREGSLEWKKVDEIKSQAEAAAVSNGISG